MYEKASVNALSTLIIACTLMLIPGSGSAAETYSKDGKECVCFPAVVIPAVWKGPPIKERKEVRV